MSAVLHHQDFYAWTQQQAQLLKNGQLNLLDIATKFKNSELFLHKI